MSRSIWYVTAGDDRGDCLGIVHQAVHNGSELLYLAVIARGPDLAALRRVINKRRALHFADNRRGAGGFWLRPSRGLLKRPFEARRPLPSGYSHLVIAPRSMLVTSGEQRFICLVPDGVSREEALVRQLNRRFPVPIHPSWAAALYADLEAKGYVEELKATGTASLSCDIDTISLARLVSDGVRRRRYPYVPPADPPAATAATATGHPPLLAAALR